MTVLGSIKPTLIRRAQSYGRLLASFSLTMDTAMWDPQDQHLMDSLQSLAPLLRGRSWEAENDAEPMGKRHKPLAVKQEQQPSQEAIMQLLKLMSQVVIQTDRNLQTLCRQDCYVLFGRVGPDGAMPLMDQMAKDWKSLAAHTPPTTSLRTHLLTGLIKELAVRATKLSTSTPGQELWDEAVRKGTINQQGGSWGYLKWSPEQQSWSPPHGHLAR